MNLKGFFKTLAAAAISGAVVSTTNAVADPAVLAKPGQLAVVAITGALVGAGGYLTQSPRKKKVKVKVGGGL